MKNFNKNYQIKQIQNINKSPIFYTVYKITNLINNKIYIGVHKTKDVNDNYMGSGKMLKRAINKYGIENFKKEIIEIFDNAEDMFNMESELVNEDFVKDINTYNIKVGGEGGFDYINENSLNNSERNRQVTSENFKNRHANGEMTYSNFKGKKHTENTKKQVSESMKKNKMVWVYNNSKEVSKKIKISELELYIANGYSKGRKMNFNKIANANANANYEQYEQYEANMNT